MKLPLIVTSKIHVAEELFLDHIIDQIHAHSKPDYNKQKLNDWVFIYNIKRVLMMNKISAAQLITDLETSFEKSRAFMNTLSINPN